MEFTERQLGRLRRALNDYRVIKGREGRLMPWKAVLNRLLMSGVTAHQYDADGNEPEFKEEALRRFATGMSTLQRDKLEDLWKFLVDQRMIAANELDGEGDDLRDFLGLHAFLANTSPDAIGYLAEISGKRRAARHYLREDVAVELTIILDASKTFARVEEILNIRMRPQGKKGEAFFAREHGERQRAVRTGYAFMSASEGHLHIFLRSGNLDDRVTYLQIVPMVPAGSQSPLQMIRTGNFEKSSVVEQTEAGRQVHTLWGNIFAFETVRSASAVVKGSEEVTP
jgi:hypothetical protein